MKIKINNYRGIKKAEFSVQPICAFFGKNGAGKSSISNAVTACMTGDPMAMSDIKRGGAMELVNDEARSGSITMETSNGTMSIEYPDAVFNVIGEMCVSSEVAIGMTDVAKMTDVKRAEFFAKLLGTEPTFDDLREAMKDLQTIDETKKLWSDILANSWDTVEKHYRQKATMKKGAWEEITGDKYGTKKASSFIPEHWSPELDTASESQLRAAIVEAQETVEAIAASNAMDDAEIDRLCEVYDSIPKLKLALEDIRENENKIVKILSENMTDTKSKDDAQRIFKERESIPELEERKTKLIENIDKVTIAVNKACETIKKIEGTLSTKTYSCPCCSASLIFSGGKLEKENEPLSQDDIAAINTELQSMMKKRDDGNKWLAEKKLVLTKLERDISTFSKHPVFDLDNELQLHDLHTEQNAKKMSLMQQHAIISNDLSKATDEVKNFDPHNQHNNENGNGDINKAREKFRYAQLDFDSWTKKQMADQAANTVIHYLEIASILSPKGLRKTKLKQAINKFNSEIESLGLWNVVVKNDLSLSIDGRRFALCCESEQWRISKSIQIATASIQNSPLIIIDRADILDNAGKNVLFKSIKKSKLKTIIMMKSDTRSNTIDLEKMNLGKSYWVENGTIGSL